jgi:hypothetical protein
MRVTIETDSVFHAKNSAYGSLLLGILFIVIGAAVAAFLFSNTIALVIGIVAILGGIYAAATADFSSINADKSTRALTVSNKSLIGGSSANYPFSNIKKIILQDMVSTRMVRQQNGAESMQSSTHYLLRMVLNDGEEIPLNGAGGATSSPLQFLFPPSERVVGKKLADFIGVEYQEIGPAQVLGAMVDRFTGGGIMGGNSNRGDQIQN